VSNERPSFVVNKLLRRRPISLAEGRKEKKARERSISPLRRRRENSYMYVYVSSKGDEEAYFTIEGG